jgi:hypothetical protein
MFRVLEPIFDGSLTRLPRSKELVCPGTFVFFLPSEEDPETKQLGRIIRSAAAGSAAVAINLYKTLSSSDTSIPSLTASCFTGTIQVVQTTEMIYVNPASILEVSFVFPYVKLLDDSNLLEVSGMDLVRILRGRICQDDIFEECFTPSFPSTYEQFYRYYGIWDDLGYRKWSEVILPVQALISRMLCRAFLLQGDNFCKRRSEPHQLSGYLWSWLSVFLAEHGSPIRNVPLVRRSKRLIVRPTTVAANSIQSVCQLIRCETEVQLKAVSMLFGNCCLIGLRDPAPSVNNSVLLSSSACNVIVPYPSVEVPFVLNTSRLGIDFEHNGSALKVTVRYCKVTGTHPIVRRLFSGTIESVPLSQLVPRTQDLGAVTINSFLKLDDGRLAYVIEINSDDGFCVCTEAQGEFPQSVRLPLDLASNKIRQYRFDELNDTNN